MSSNSTLSQAPGRRSTREELGVVASTGAVGERPRTGTAWQHLVRRVGVSALPDFDRRVLHRPEHGRDRDHGAAAHLDRHDGRDRPVCCLDARALQHSARISLRAPLANRVGDRGGPCCRRRRWCAQRGARDQAWVAVDRGDDRHADTLSRHRGNRARNQLGRRVSRSR